MEEVVCSCLQCEAELGCFKNSWNGIGSTYFSPVYPPVTYINGFETTGDVHRAAPGSQVENSFLQDLACRNCKIVIGMRCDSVPEGHFLKKNQLLLRLAHMSVISFRTGEKATLSVQEKFALTLSGAKKLSTPRRASTVQPSPRSQTPSISSQKVTNGFMLPPPTLPKTQEDLERFKKWTEDAISKQKKDIDRIGGAVERIERGMKSFKDFMDEIRAEFLTSRQEMATQEDVAAIREDVNGFRDELASFQQIQRPKEKDLAIIQGKLNDLRRDIDSNSIAKVSQNSFDVLVKDVQILDRTTDRIQPLEGEIDCLKMRLELLEEITRSSSFSKTVAIGKSALGFASSTNTMLDVDQIEHAQVEMHAFVDPRHLDIMSSPQQDPSGSLGIPHTSPTTVTKPPGQKPAHSRDSEDSVEATEQVVKEMISLPKRKHYQVEDSGDASNVERATKRSRRSSNKIFTARAKTTQQQEPVLISSDRDSSPVLGDDDNEDQDNQTESNQPTPVPQPVPQNRALSGLRKPRRLRTMSFNGLPEERPVLNRTASGYMAPRNKELPVPPSQLTPVIHKRRRQSILEPLLDLNRLNGLRKRDSNGLSLTPTAKIDRRSLRQKNSSSDKKNEAPFSQPSEMGISTNNYNSKAPDKPPASIEKNNFQIVIPRLPTPELEIGVDADWPFQCEACGKRYKRIDHFERHKLHPACANTVNDDPPNMSIQNEEDDGARKRKMAERERLVKQMLEREMAK